MIHLFRTLLIAATCCLLDVRGRADTRPFPADPSWLMESWETDDGLPENSATAMAQTPDGYLWFGTFNGLVRFDGVKFTVFNPANTPGLPSASIVNLHADRAGGLWVSTDRGLCYRDGHRWRRFAPAEVWEGNYVRTFAERANGDLLITSFDGHIAEYAGGRFRALPTPGQPGRGCFAHADAEGRWWVAGNEFVGRWDGGRWTEMIPLDESVADTIAAGTGRNGDLLLVVRKELKRWRPGEPLRSQPLPMELYGGVWGVSEDSAGNVWICTYHRGLVRIRPDGTGQEWRSANGLPADAIRFVFEDREHNLWLGTSGGGLTRFKERRFRVFGPESSRVERNVRGVAPGDGDSQWLATFGGGLFECRPERSVRVPLPGFPSTTVYAQTVLWDRAGRTWVGSLGQGVWRREGAETCRIPFGESGGETVTLLFEDSRGAVWIGGDRELVRHEDGAQRPLPGGVGARVRGAVCAAETPGGALWFSNLEGVFRLAADGLSEIREGGRPLRDVLCLKADRDDSVWMGSRHEGLWHWAPGKLARLDAAIGFPAPGVNGILEDDHGFFWMPTRRGVVRVARAGLEAALDGRTNRLGGQLLDMHDGLLSAECPGGHQPVCARDRAGRLWFATLKGVAVVDPDEFVPNLEPPPVHIEAVTYRLPARGSLERKSVQWVAPFTRPLRLPPGAHGLEIQYTGLSFSAPGKVQFQVRLDGRDADWSEVTDRRTVRFDDLPPGDYVFRVRAANNDGLWNETGASLAFLLAPRYWQTWWFRSGAALFLVGVGAGLVGWRARARVRVAVERERIAGQIRELAGRLIRAQEEERRRIARELHDDFSQRLALLSVEMELFGRAWPGADPSAPKVDEMARRVRELSTEVHRIAYELHPAKLDQLGLAAAARAFCRELSKTAGVAIDFTADDIPRETPPDVALCLYRILQESLQNVVRHSGARAARVELRGETGGIRLTVTDAGRGFDPGSVRGARGLGLLSMGERVRLVQGRLSVESEPGRGTTIVVSVPLTDEGGAV